MHDTLKQSRTLIADLNAKRPFIYWFDFLLSLAVSNTAAALFLWPSGPRVLWIGCYIIAVIFLYRVSLFMHEIAHFRRGEMRAFKVVWNLLAGIPMLIPSFFYESHIDHHNTRRYGTQHDGEYLPLASQSYWGLAAYFSQIFYLPILTLIRFGVVTPISMLHPRIRIWVLEHWSSFVINLRYKRELLPNDPVFLWGLIEVACFLRLAILIPGYYLGMVPWYGLFLIYALAVGVLTLNHVRTLAAHRYTGQGTAMSHEEQMLDSTNIDNNGLLTLLLCPIGLRFHALHHLFPSLPYHNLAKAHRRLTEKLPADAVYHKCTYPSLSAAIRELIAHLNRQYRSRDFDNHGFPPNQKTYTVAPNG